VKNRLFRPLHIFPFKTGWGWAACAVTEEGARSLILPRKRKGDALLLLEQEIEKSMPAYECVGIKGLPGSLSARREQAIDEVCRFVNGNLREFSIEPDWEGRTDFQKAVWSAARRIPYGETRTYGELAAEVRCPLGFRAIGQCMARNPLPLIVPCHRVIAAGGSPGGFSSGLDMKTRLLKLECS